jgi:hypothetical protein
MKGILPLLSMNSGCDYHRIILPMTHLGVNLKYFQNKKVGDVIKDTKVLIFNRTPHGRLDYILEAKKKFDFKIVVDLDDYWVLHPKHSMYQTWERHKIGQQIVDALKIADEVICTTNLLADKIKVINKNVHVIPNALPFEHDQFSYQKENSEFTRFIYAGGGTHFWDIKELTVPFKKVNNNPQLKNAQFILAGFNGETKESEKSWERTENVFNLNGTLHNYIRKYSLPLESYMDHYIQSDVSLVPLEENHFNRFKSNLKIIEAGCKYNVAICSNTSPYSDEPNKDVVLYAKNASQWYEHIKYCTLNRSFLQDKGEQLGEYVRENYNLFKVNEYRKQLFEKLMS